MEHWLPTLITPDPAPALTRGMAILGTLARDGASTLETLVRSTGFPKTSVLRLLGALCDCGAVERDEVTKRYSAKVIITLRPETGMTLIHRAREVMVELSEHIQHTSELYRVMPSGLTMVERAEPEAATVLATARIGHYRDLSEIESLSLVYRAWVNKSNSTAPTQKLWQWDEHCNRMAIKTIDTKQLVKETAQQGYAFDLSINPHSVRRYSVPIFNGKQKLWGILALAQVVHPSNPKPQKQIIQKITEAGQILSESSSTPIFKS